MVRWPWQAYAILALLAASGLLLLWPDRQADAPGDVLEFRAPGLFDHVATMQPPPNTTFQQFFREPDERLRSDELEGRWLRYRVREVAHAVEHGGFSYTPRLLLDRTPPVLEVVLPLGADNATHAPRLEAFASAALGLDEGAARRLVGTWLSSGWPHQVAQPRPCEPGEQPSAPGGPGGAAACIGSVVVGTRHEARFEAPIDLAPFFAARGGLAAADVEPVRHMHWNQGRLLQWDAWNMTLELQRLVVDVDGEQPYRLLVNAEDQVFVKLPQDDPVTRPQALRWARATLEGLGLQPVQVLELRVRSST
ncbi:MAG TPA: hypothetical protein VFH47_01360 [Candidatus Thermoplasmatota archaeon]|nr:hypothetical protein [Candidatus Thermoplasmatota archaeon]